MEQIKQPSTSLSEARYNEISIPHCDKFIKFRSLNRDHNFIFLKNKNSIEILEPIKLVHIYSLLLNEFILNFEVSPKDSSILLNTKTSLELYELVGTNLSDTDLKIKYMRKYCLSFENIEEISVSSLGDVFAVIDKHRRVHIFNKKLEVVKNINFQLQILPKEIDMFPLDFFQITYDTRNICACKFNYNKISLIYKCKNCISSDIGDTQEEYAENIVTFKENILYLKEFQRDFLMYIQYQDSSIFFILTTGLNFLIVRKVFELSERTYDYIPNLNILLYIDLSTHTEIMNFPSISFSLLYDNQNPIFRSSDTECKTLFDELQAGIVYPELWQKHSNKNTLSESERNTFLNFNKFYHNRISSDYILFNFKENLILYRIDGLQSPPFNNPTVETMSKIQVDENFTSHFLLLKLTKTLDRKYCIYFLDEHYYLIRKYVFNDVTTGSEKIKTIYDSDKAFKIYQNILKGEFNEKNRKTFVLEYNTSYQRSEQSRKDSLMIFLNSKLELSKMIIVKDYLIENLHWVMNSDFVIFTLCENHRGVESIPPRIGIIHLYSKFLEKKICEVEENILADKHLLINPVTELNLKLNSFSNILLESQMNVITYADSSGMTKQKLGYNEVNTQIVLVTDKDVLYGNLSLENNESLSYERQFLGKLVPKWTLPGVTFKEQSTFETANFLFHEGKIYFYELEKKVNIFSIKELDEKGNLRTIFQTIIFKELLYTNIYYNNYIIFISSHYINSYDFLNRTFYRVRNDYLKEKHKENSSISLFKGGNFIYMLFISASGAEVVRIPRNKNFNEQFSVEFDYKFQISSTCSNICISNNMIILNESQIERLDQIAESKHNLQFACEKKELFLVNSNPLSLFDLETFLDFFLSDNEEIIKLILNILCDLYWNNVQHMHKFPDAYQNSKLIPNLYQLNSIDYIIKIIFENDLNVLSTIGAENILERKESVDRNQPSTTYQYKKTKSFKLVNSKLKFKTEEDIPERNPILIWCENRMNLTHLKQTYEIISSENTRNVDHLTKYFILKMKSKNEDFEKDNFKLSTADLCWISLINDQEYLLKFLSREKPSMITWKFMKMFSIPIWVKSDIKLKELLEHVGRNEYKLLLKNDPMGGVQKNLAENVALYFYLAGKQNLVIDLYEREPFNENVKNFISRSFAIVKNRKAAKENGDALMNKKKYIFAAYFYLLADDIRSALDMTLVKMNDINLTIAILRMCQSPYGNNTWKQYYTLEKIYQEYFINFGLVIRDPWLVIYGYLGQKRIDLALEYILNYDIEYNFENNSAIFENIDEYKSNLEIVRKIFGINVFDYKILIFAKSLEKIYLSQVEEAQNNVKTVANTNFDDFWDMDDDGGTSAPQTTKLTSSSDLKILDIDYSNLSSICLVNSLKRGALYAPIINLYKLHHRNSYMQLHPQIRIILKNLICDRIVLDTIYIPEQNQVEKYFIDIEKLFEYLDNNKILKKKELYKEVNNVLQWLDNYHNAYIPCYKSNQIRQTLLIMTNFIERLMIKNMNVLVNFNFYENINLEKIDGILSTIVQVANFLINLLKVSENAIETDGKQMIQNKLIDNFDVQSRLLKSEQNLYIFRIIFMFYFYILFVSKIILSFNCVTTLFEKIQDLVTEHKKIEKFNGEKLYTYLDSIILHCSKLSKKIKNEISNKNTLFRDDALSFYIQILNLAIITSIKQLMKENIHLHQNELVKKFKINEKYENYVSKSDHYIHEEFKFAPQLSGWMTSYIENFDTNFEKYIKNYMKVELIFEIHEELKMIYMKNLSQDSNFYKYCTIAIKKLFKNPSKLSKFEIIFNIKSHVVWYISGILKHVKYEKSCDPPVQGMVMMSNNDQTEQLSKYGKESIRIVNQIFKTGFEIAHFPDGQIVHGFAINNCDISTMAISCLQAGHRKLNILNNLLIRKRADDYLKLADVEPSNWEEIYKTSSEMDFKPLIEHNLYNKYNEIVSIINHDICKKSKSSIFISTTSQPPDIFNELASENYYEDISLNNINSSSYCKLIESHSQLPLYITSNNKGIISLWSYSSDSRKSIDEFYIERLTKDNMGKMRNIARMKFNSYGNEFLACDNLGNLLVWAFDHIKGAKVPKISLLNNGNKFCKDACFLNNSGIIASTVNKLSPQTTLWDLMLPLNQSNIGEVNIGGNLITSLSSDASIVIANDKPGVISFIDIRKMEEVSNFQAHLEEIKALQISDREHFMVTFGIDSFVKIWDLSNKTSPLLIESFQPFTANKDNKKNYLNLQLANGMLFASKDNSIKILRNKLY